MLVYTFALFLYLSNKLCVYEPHVYPNNFNIFKLINSLAWFVLSLFAIKINENKSISFFLTLILWVEIIPIGVIYSFCDDSAIFFNTISFGYFTMIFLTQSLPSKKISATEFLSQNKLITIISITTFILLLIIYKYNGLPSLTALNLLDVYQLRKYGNFYLDRNLYWLLQMVVVILIPFAISSNLTNNDKKIKTKLVAFLSLSTFLFYLYTGHKVYLFGLLLSIFISYFSSIKYFQKKILTFLSLSIFFLTFISSLNTNWGSTDYILSFIARRSLLLPARIIYFYNDYFSSRNNYYFYGILPQFCFPYGNPYANDPNMGDVIGIKYLNAETNASTGHIGEAVTHFGLIGILISWSLYVFLLKILENLEKKSSKALVIGTFTFFIYYLTNAPLMSSFISGPALMLTLICLVYKPNLAVKKLGIITK